VACGLWPVACHLLPVGWLEMPREGAVVLVALLQKRVAAFLCFGRAVGETGCFAGKQLLTDEAIVGKVECVFQHPLRRRALGNDLGGPLECGFLEIDVIDDGVDHAHFERFLSRVRAAQEEDLPGTLLADLAGEERRTVSAVERGDIGIGLFEHGVFSGGEREVAHDMEAMTAADGPTGHDGDHHFGHESNESLHLQDVEPSESCDVTSLRSFVLVAVRSANPLVTAGTERPAAILWRRTVSCEEHRANVGGHAGVVERRVQLIHGVRTERVTNLGPIERYSNGADVPGSVVGDVREIEPLDGVPCGRVEYLRSHEAIL